MWVVEGSIAYKKLSLNLIVMSFFAKLILNISFRVCEKFYLFLNDHWFRTKERLEGIATFIWNSAYETLPNHKDKYSIFHLYGFYFLLHHESFIHNNLSALVQTSWKSWKISSKQSKVLEYDTFHSTKSCDMTYCLNFN